MTVRNDVTAGTNAALHAASGTKYCHCVEMKFGSTIAARDGAPTVPATYVIWAGRGDLTQLRVYTSINDGATWDRVERSGSPIPGLAIGDPTTNRRVRARLIFANGAPGVVVDSFTLRVKHADGTIKERIETGTDLATGQLRACGHNPSVNGLVAIPDVSLRFLGNRGGLTNPNEGHHDGNGNKQGLHLSHGAATDLASTIQIERQADNDNRFSDAACAFEGWFLTEKTSGFLVGCTKRLLNENTIGFSLELVETSDDAARLRFSTVEVLPDAIGGSFIVREHNLRSAPNSIKPGRFYHVAFSYDGFWGTLLLNGSVCARNAFQAELNGKRTSAGAFVPFGIVLPFTGPWTFGRHPVLGQNQGPTTNSFQGRMTEWRIYNRALTSGAVVQRMGRRLSPNEVTTMKAKDGLLAYLRMAEGNGRFVFDLAGNNQHFAWHQQQVGSTPLPPQLAWMPDTVKVWRGFPIDKREVRPGILENGDPHPGRETPPLDIDADGDVLRLCDADRPVTFNGKTFLGVGGVGAISAIQEPGDLVPTGVDLTINGLLPQHVSIAQQALYLDRPCTVWQVTWDADDVQQEEFLLFDGRMDEMNIRLRERGEVTVAARTVLSNWRRPINRRWNDESHRAVFPDDHGFRDQADMVDRQVWWPPRIGENSASPGGGQ